MRRAMDGDWVAEDGDRVTLIATAEEGRPRLPHDEGGPIELTDGGPEGETELYRHFDAAGKLLYVGISLSTVVRLAQHRLESEWFDRVVHITIERFPTRIEAMIAERVAILKEAPECNKARWTINPEGAAP
jgi:hypothetical protein